VTKEIKTVVKAAERHGLRCVFRGKHPRLVDAHGRGVSFSGTPSCPHAANNLRRDLARYLGVVLS
jgi:hypothetical protein